MYLPTYIGALIITLAGVGAWSWLETPEEHKVIDVMASREPELALPVYAQFSVTQIFTLENATRLQRLEVPIYFPSREAGLKVDLRHEQQSVWRWQVAPATEGVVVASLPLLSALPSSGSFELTFSAPHISHEEQASAPRLFIESADEQYPGGHYRVAENDKQGDISLSVYEQWTVRDRLLELLARRPLKVAGQFGAVVLVVLLVASLPSVLARTVSLPAGQAGRTHQVREQAGKRKSKGEAPYS